MLGGMDFRYRPISSWPGEMTPQTRRRASTFRASDSKTHQLLARELDFLQAKDVVLEVALREEDIRLDGMPRANAKPPEHPGVVLSFDSKFGPLRYACDRFLKRGENLRAIALGLHHLRAVDRYGITQRGEQYSGWKQLPPGPSEVVVIHADEDPRDELRRIILQHGSERQRDGMDDLDDYQLVRRARRLTHPDVAGSKSAADEWATVEDAAMRLQVG